MLHLLIMKKPNKKIVKKTDKTSPNTKKVSAVVKRQGAASFERTKTQAFYDNVTRVAWIDESLYMPNPDYDF